MNSTFNTIKISNDITSYLKNNFVSTTTNKLIFISKFESGLTPFNSENILGNIGSWTQIYNNSTYQIIQDNYKFVIPSDGLYKLSIISNFGADIPYEIYIGINDIYENISSSLYFKIQTDGTESTGSNFSIQQLSKNDYISIRVNGNNLYNLVPNFFYIEQLV